jgi:hypothetical protein
VYSFPNGHTKDGNIPRVDTLFIDFDFEGGDYDADDPDYDAWRRDISHLLVRVRRAATFLRDQETAVGWRAALSGHKGVHLFLDFPEIAPEVGSYRQFTTGLNEYANALIDDLESETGIGDLSKYVDVTSSDLGRLCRVPNTRHSLASANLPGDRYCVPVSLDELASLDVDEYERIAREPRPVPYDGRTENERAGERIAQHIRHAEPATGSGATSYGPADKNPRRVTAYQENANEDINIDDVKMLTSDRPCIWEFYERDDKWDYGDQSHSMEVYCIDELRRRNVPIEVIKEFLNSADGYDEQYSEEIIHEVISRDYNRTSIERLQEKAPEFCGYEWCDACQRVCGAATES